MLKKLRYHRTNQKGTLLYEDDAGGIPDLKKPIFDELTAPNLEMRIGSIYALERVANDSEVDRAQISEIFSAYVSNNFNAPAIFPHTSLERFSTDELEPSLDVRFRGAPDGLGLDWVKEEVKKPRPDTRAAISVILRCIERFGRIENKGGTPALTFTDANLQRADFCGADLSGATFEDCQLDGANLEKTDLSGAKFINCSLIGASISRADLSGAHFDHSTLECVNASNINNMSGCLFWECDCSGITFSDANMSGSHFVVTARKAIFRAKMMDNTTFSMCDIRDGELSAHSMRRLRIHATWVPKSGVQLMERVQTSGGGSGTRMAKKVRLFAHPSAPHRAHSDSFTQSVLGMGDVEQGDAELFDPDS